MTDETTAEETMAEPPVTPQPTADETTTVKEEPAPVEDEPVTDLTVAEPAASSATPRPPRGIWTDEQAEALRTRVRDVTTRVVDRAAGAVIETVNNVAGAIRSRTSDRRGDGTRR
jgi:hypothetical protein